MYSHNSLLLEGDQVEIQEFVERAKYRNKEEALTTDFSFRKFIPVPKGLSNEWEWCKDNWGVDWENIVYYNAQKQTYYFNYDESLASAIQGFLVMSKQSPQIKFTFEYFNFDFEDENLAVRGKTEFRDGVMISEEKSRVRVIKCSCCDNIKSYEKIEQSEDLIDAS